MRWVKQSCVHVLRTSLVLGTARRGSRHVLCTKYIYAHVQVYMYTNDLAWFSTYQHERGVAFDEGVPPSVARQRHIGMHERNAPSLTIQKLGAKEALGDSRARGRDGEI